MKTFVNTLQNNSNSNVVLSKLLFVLLVLTIFFTFKVQLLSQNPDQISTEGTDFWFTFMPNYHNPYNDVAYSSYDSLYIYISARFPTKGTIYYYEDRPVPQVKAIAFEIPNDNGIYQYSLSHFYTALRSYTTSQDDDNEKVSKRVFHVVTEDPCSVYALDYAEKSAEAFIVLPSRALGREYFINSYNSHRISSGPTPSQFAIVAQYDNTNIKIVPAAKTRVNGIDTQNITLNKGEVYLVQANVEGELGDLTGSQIIADTNVAVFSGHQRSAIPKEWALQQTSRDCLVEQMLPVHTWGKKVIITPFAKTTHPTGTLLVDTMSGVYRALASMDNTNIYENDVLVATINKGEYYEGILKPAMISSENPIMVATFMPSSSDGKIASSVFEPWGDPSMVAIPPIEQYKADINVMNAQIMSRSYNGNWNEEMFKEQYMTIILPDLAKNYIMIDEVSLNPDIFIPIGNTGYSYANLVSTDGQHTVQALFPIAVIIYGYGAHVSYGYLGGMTFFDLTSRFNLQIADCYDTASFTYNEPYNSAITSYEIISSSNCNISEKTYNSWQLVLDVNKINPALDSYFSVKISNMFGVDTVFTDTLLTNYMTHNVAKIQDDDYSIDFGNNVIGTLNAQYFTLVNTGTTPIQIDESSFTLSKNINFTIGKSNIIATLQPNDSVIIEVFYAPTSTISQNKKESRVDTDTLTIETQCNNYKIVLQGTPLQDTMDMVGQCDVPIRMVADTISMSYSLPSISPNPVSNNSFNYSFYNDISDNTTISIYNEHGNMINEVSKSYLQKGLYEISIDASKLPAGTYFIGLTSSSDKHYTKFIVSD